MPERNPCDDRGVTDDNKSRQPGANDASDPARTRAFAAGPGQDDATHRAVPAGKAGAEDLESAYELLQRGRGLLRQRHHAQAAVVLERAARLEPGKGSILEALGRAYYNSAQHDRSRETFEAMLEIDPSAHYAHFALGQSLKRLGRDREARTHLRLAVALSPSTAIYRSALARMPEPGPE